MRNDNFDMAVANGETPIEHEWELLLKNENGEAVWIGDRDADLTIMDGAAYCDARRLDEAIDNWGPIQAGEMQNADLAEAMGLGGRVSLNNGNTWMAPENCSEAQARELLEQLWVAATSPGNSRLYAIMDDNRLDYYDSPIECLVAIMAAEGWDFTF